MSTGTQTILSCRVEQHGDATVVRVAGEIDRWTEDDFAQAVDESMRGRPTRLTVDLRDVTFMGTSGLRVLVEAQHETQRMRIVLGVVPGRGVARRSLEITGLDQMLRVFPTVAEALARA
ncbi:STAS domain-containing protein [Kibdelosporangium persicum]|uniref:Anti-sigma factor antagonist n=1 Tax=Kibdelosporangium persicum TaxID=2698649 RepID=A0ABX2F6I4_9PSEU|nr:STAS domain-containing protein [Kibdelosporangium persicum]NRN66497.1 Anti-anti-sigma factor [Kibdelosporangium persicum]